MSSARRFLPLLAAMMFACWRTEAADDGTYIESPFPSAPSSIRDPDFPPRATPDSVSSRAMPQIRIVFFPPTTPVYGAPIPNTPPPGNSAFGRLYPAPDDLADFVNEYFYPALGTRLAENTFTPKLRDQLDAYNAHRIGLLNELLAKLTLLQSEDAAAREAGLREFAGVQTPRIVALEKEADQVREDIIRGGLLATSADWNHEREWHLGDPTIRPGAMTASAENQVIRAAAYYQKGLTPEQRGLLLEIAVEGREDSSAARGRGATAKRDPLVIFFSPETTRLRLPATLTPALTASLGVYNSTKDALKRELRETVIAQEKSSDSKRTKAFQELADRQWPQLLALAKSAEEVRQAFAAVPEPPLPSLPPQLPSELAARIETYKHDMTELNRERGAFLQGLATIPVSIRGRPEAGAQAMREAFEERGHLLQQKMAVFQQENAARIDALRESLKSINADLTAFALTQTDPATGRPMDAKALMRRINEADQQFAKIGIEGAIYPRYRIAMLQPGLSPEQRRLLFGAALVGLAQPLPPGEPMPGRYVRMTF